LRPRSEHEARHDVTATRVEDLMGMRTLASVRTTSLAALVVLGALGATGALARAAEPVRYTFVATLDAPLGNLQTGHLFVGSFAYDPDAPGVIGASGATFSGLAFSVSAGTQFGPPGIETLKAVTTTVHVGEDPRSIIVEATLAANATLRGVALSDVKLVLVDDAQATGLGLPSGALGLDDFGLVARVQLARTAGGSVTGSVVRLRAQPELELVVARGDLVPGGGLTFTSVSQATKDGDDVAFKGGDSAGGDGIYARLGGELVRIADRSTPIPTGGGTFYLMVRPYLDNGAALFLGANGNQSVQALYVGDGSWISMVAGSDRASYNAPRLKDGTVAFFQRFSCGVCLATGGNVTSVVPPGTTMPGTSGPFQDFTSLSYDGITIVFGGVGPGSEQALFAWRDGALQTIADLATIIPGRDVPFESFGETDVHGDDIVFEGGGAFAGNSRPVGVFRRVGGAWQVVADNLTPVPGAPAAVSFSQLSAPAVANGQVVWQGRAFGTIQGQSFNLDGLYGDRGAGPEMLFDTLTMIDGKRPSSFSFLNEGFDGEGAAFSVGFTDGTSGIYVVALCRPNSCGECNGGDLDGDGVGDSCDNCAEIANSDQTDTLGTPVGDACEDSDADGLLDATELALAEGGGCPDPSLADSDGDGIDDGDEIADGTDPCVPEDDDGCVPVHAPAPDVCNGTDDDGDGRSDNPTGPFFGLATGLGVLACETFSSTHATFVGPVVAPGSPECIADMCADGVAAAALLGSVAVYGKTDVKPWRAIELTGTRADLNVFTVKAADLSVASSLTISVPAGAAAIINVTGAAVTIANMGMSLAGASPADVVFNLRDAGTVTIANVRVLGSVLAPAAAVQVRDGEVQGGVFARTLRVERATLRAMPFVRAAACLAPPPPPPATTCVVKVQISAWTATAFGANVTLTQTGPAANGWTLDLVFGGGQVITSLWNATHVQSGAAVKVTHPSWSPTLPSGSPIGFGFNGAGPGLPPVSAVLNGIVCSVQ